MPSIQLLSDYQPISGSRTYSGGSILSLSAADYAALEQADRGTRWRDYNVVNTDYPSFTNLPAGAYVFPIASAPSSSAGQGGLNQFRVLPFYWPSSQLTIARMGAEVVSAGDAGSVLRIGLYTDNGGVPGSRLLEAGVIDGAIVGTQDITLASPLVLQAGWYWIGAVMQNAATTLPTFRQPSNPVVQSAGFLIWASSTSPLATNQLSSGYTMINVSGALPANYTISSLANTHYRIHFKLA